MRTPRLDRRIVVVGVSVVVVAMLVIDVLVYAGLRATLMRNLDDLLDERAGVAAAEGARLSPPELANRLTELGIRATVNAPGGPYGADPMSPSIGIGLPPPPRESGAPFASRQITLPGGGNVVVYARRGGIDSALRQVVLYELLGLAIATSLAALLLTRLTRLTLRPLREMAASTRRVSQGDFGERLHPDRPDTSLGQLASAHDEMLDALALALDDARTAQRQSERLYRETRQIIDTAAGAYVAVEQSGTIVEWNRHAEALFSVPRAEALGRHFLDFVDIPADRTEGVMEQLLAWIRDRGVSDLVEATATRPDGRRVPVELSMWSTEGEGLPVYSALIHDITPRREGQRAMSQLAAIVESAQEAIFSESLAGSILTWNVGAEVLYGYKADDAIGRPASMLVPPQIKAEMESFCEYARRGRLVPRHETTRLTMGGETVDVAVTVSPIRDERGVVVAISTIARDLTEQRWLAKTLNTTLGRLEKAQFEARLAEERSRRFLADAAHQLRSPITGIRACAETLLRGAEAAQRDQLLADLVREASRASRLLSSLLQLARVDAGQPLDIKPADLVEVCRAELDRARALVPDLELVLHAGRPAAAAVDHDAIREVLTNLLDNARRHARQRIDVTVTIAADHIVVRIENDGPPVALDMTERIFDRFVSMDRQRGSGLGLPIARELARAHGGDLVYRENAFVLTVPASAIARVEGADVG